MKFQINTLLFAALTLTLIILEFWASNLAYDNFGWGMSGLLYLLTFCNIISIVLFFFNQNKFAIFILVLLALLIVPVQLVLTQKYILEKEEGANIANYIYQQKILTGTFPKDLNEYTFMFPFLESDFTYQKDNEEDFIILFSVGTKNTSHYFRHSRGYKWNYYDD